MASRGRNRRNKVSEVLVQKRVIRRKGPVVTFSGVEGVGKTSLASVAAEELKRQGFRVRILRLYPIPLKTTAKRVLDNLFRSALPATEKATARRISANIATALWKQTYFRLVCMVSGMVTRLLSARGIAVVCDRYVYDSLAELLYEGRCDENSFKKLAASIPAPDVAFLLRMKKETVHERRSNRAPEELCAFQEKYLKLTDIGDFWIVDTDDSRRAKMEVIGILSYAGRRW